MILHIVDIRATNSFEKYMGLPPILGRSKIKAFHNLVDKIWLRIFNWKSKFLSVTGKEIMLKSVL